MPIKLTPSERKRWAADLATPVERQALDKLSSLYPYGQMHVLSREKGEDYRFVNIVLRRRAGGCAFGIMFMPLKEVKRRIKQIQARRRAEYWREAKQNVGAYI